MDFLDPKKRKAHRIKLLIGYSLVAVALTFASIILLYQSYGYDYDPKTGRITQNGLVFVDAKPAGADIYLNGESKGRTDARLDISSGTYNLELAQKGYRTWKRQFTLEASSIERFLYPFLFPSELSTSDVRNFTAVPGMIAQSPNRERVLVQQPGDFQKFDLIDISDKTIQSTTLNLPPDLLTVAGANHQLSLVEWSSNNRHVVLSHQYEAGTEFFLLDVESPNNSINLTKTFTTPFTTIALHDKKFNQYYLYDANTQTLMRARLDPATVTPYQADVLGFKPHGADEVAIITDAEAGEGKVWLKIREGDEEYDIRQLPIGDRYIIDMARFDNNWYVGAGSAAETKVYLFKNPVATIKRGGDKLPLPVAVLRTPAVPEFLAFSTNSRFIAAQSGKYLAVYDAETDRQSRYDSGLGLTSGQQLKWMDGNRLIGVVGGKTVVMDYDGTNQQTLTDAINGFPPIFDPAYEALFTVSPSISDSRLPALVRTELRI